MVDRFHRWMSAHGRSYPSAEEKLYRFEIYRHNAEYIDASNNNVLGLGYELSENNFTDLTNEEFVVQYTGGALANEDVINMIITTLAGNVSDGHETTMDWDNLNIVVPKQFDWREKGAVTPAKQQGKCGCCWAFSVVATVESLIKIKGGNLLDLSEQELLACDLSNAGYASGWPSKALEWIIAKGGVVPEAEYPYVEQQGKCRDIKSVNRVGKITGIKKVTSSNELALTVAILENPVSVKIDASGDILQHYKTGVYKGPCSATKVNHGVVAVGYGVGEDGVKYWILKNSWGENWGQKGFFFMRKGADGANGLCGILTGSIYPVMVN